MEHRRGRKRREVKIISSFTSRISPEAPFRAIARGKGTIIVHRVRTGPGKPGKSWNFNIPKSRPGNPGKSILVMESHGKLKFYKTLTKYFTCFNLPVITII
jgi:hypothetical protein